MRLKSIRDLPIRGKRLFLRLDFNVPLSAPDAEGHRQVLDDNRIKEAIPTIKYAREQGAKIIIASHLGRPKGKRNEEFSMMPAAHRLAELMGVDVMLMDDCIGEGIELKATNLVGGEIMMLENLRFYKEEEENDLAFAKKLARLCDVYVTDAFGTAHRMHASTYALPSIMPDRGMGLLVEKELKYFDTILENPAQPFYLILGGAKVSDKIKTIHTLLKKVQGVVVGGAMAYAFMKANGETIQPEWKQPAPEDVEAAKELIAEASRKNIPFLLPTDTKKGFDIGPKTTQTYIEFLSKAKTVFWNGPLGWFEKPEYAEGTNLVAKALAETACTKIVGGGDTVSAINQAGVAEKYNHLSTGGGAALEYLENGSLPGIEILRSGHRPVSDDLIQDE
ncbi:MAG: phosphoglycerate kinase [Bdellovibrionales bacterium]|nr:phosphoglycerate kinase [Oligoflexia bacterium]